MTTLSATKNFRVIPLIFILAIIFSTCEKPERIAEIASTASSEADISFTSVILKGEITDLGSAPIEDFGIIVSENASFLNPIPLSANKQAVKGPFQIEFTGLKINTLYYFRAYLTITGEDPIYGKTLQFRTKDYSTPAVTAGTVNSITMTSASLQGEVTSDGGESGTIRGLCWALTANPTITSCLDSTVNGSGKGTFTGSITGLAAGTRYYVRTYARNSKGTAYNSADIEFRTHDKPKVTTTAITSISASGCSTGGNVSDDGEVPVTARGVCWSTSTGPTADLTTKTVDGSGKGEFTSEIGGLVPGTLYYVRAYATNQYGTGYGSELSFTTFKAPNALTLDATLIGNTTATLNGSINTNGFTTTVVFEYGTSTAYGSTITAVQSPVTGAAITNVHANITGLNPGTTYHFRVLASNSGGDYTANDMSFTTVQPSDAITDPASAITTSSVTLNGRINAKNSSSMVSFEYGLTTSYGSTIAASPGTVTGNTLTTVSAALSGLTPRTEYHYRVRSISDGGTTYGEDLSFRTLKVPDASTSAASSVTAKSAVLTASVNAFDSETTVTFEYGLTTSYGTTVNADQNPVNGSTATIVSAPVSGLNEQTEYHYRVKAVSVAGTTYGTDMTFTTLKLPVVSTDPASLIGNTTVTLNGKVDAYNSESTVTFEYGTTTSYGTVVSATPGTVTGYSNTPVLANLTGLTPGTTYHFRVKAVSAAGTSYGGDQSFITSQPPLATVAAATSITTSSATLNGSVNANNLSTSVSFEYGLSTTYGSSVTGTPSPVSGNSNTAVSASISGLLPGTTYHYRVTALSSGGTTNSSDGTFTTEGAVTDYDGNLYNTVIIGTQTWLSENLKVTHYRNGDPIPNLTDNTAWAGTQNGAYSWYNNDLATHKAVYGGLYNYYATVDNRNLCPAGWHVPTQAEWTTLINYLGGATVAGGKLKESGTSHWTTPNTGADNSSGFTALPGGVGGGASFGLIGVNGRYWTSSELSGTSANALNMHYTVAEIQTIENPKTDGLSVRCIKGEGVVLPAVTTTAATAITSSGASTGGNVSSEGGSPVIAKGVCYGTSENPTIAGTKTVDGNGTGSFTSNITGLSPGTTYHVRAYATNSVGTSYGNDLPFITGKAPDITCEATTNITTTSATLNGTVNANGLSTTVTFEYGLTSQFGTIVAAVPNTVTGNTPTAVSVNISGLNPGTTYYFSVHGVNSGGEHYCSTSSFNTNASSTVTDYDGNVYNIVTIGTQEWMGANLKTTKYNDGLTIPLVSDQGTWGGLTTHAFCWYGNDEATYKSTYGAMYNWYAVNTGKLCPSGWHIPTDAEWTALATYLGGTSLSGGKLKEAGLAHWLTPNTGATDEVGFTALPGGYRGNDFYELTRTARWWSLTESGISAWTTSLSYTSANQSRIAMSKMGGMSVRCIKGTYPLVESAAATSVTSTTATLNGRVNPNSVSTVVTFEYGLTTGYGSEITATQSPLAGTTFQSVSASASSLAPNTTYHFRVKAVNTGGTSYGTDMTFITPALPPSATTGSATSVTANTATLAGTVNANGVSSTVTFEYGTTTGYGTEVTADQSPVAGSTNTAVSKAISGLTASTTYHFRVKAVSAGGTTYGGDQTFTTSSAPLTVTDIDGNEYNIIQVGAQYLLQGNLKVTHFSNGDPITYTPSAAWAELTIPGYCDVNGSSVNFNLYGNFYNYYSIIDARNVCPTGWHVPSWSEWDTFINALGGAGVAGGKMKETGTMNWTSPNIGATNASGFTGEPGGYRHGGWTASPLGWAQYLYFGSTGVFWVSDRTTHTSVTLLSSSEGITNFSLDYTSGASIRCFKGPLSLVETLTPTAVASTSVTFNGKVNPNGVSTTVTFEYGLTTSYGSTATASQSPITGAVPVNVSSGLTGLTPNTTYHYRVKAVNSGGTSYGADMTFTTPATVADVDGNVYNTVIIGTQTWMQENLKTTKYNDNTAIPLVTSGTTWGSMTTPAYCWYNNDETTNKNVYGAMYNWYTVETNKLCPSGFHVPSSAEWTLLASFLGGETIAGGKLKETGFAHWASPNTGATNETRFTSLPGGYREIGTGSFERKGELGFWWTSTGNGSAASRRAMGSDGTYMSVLEDSYRRGMSIRCIKD